jgi:2',3'-cyclic-nucleotide 2'-phosphodiesterase (5'-nucleotidase family)
LRLIHYNDVYHVDASSAEPVGGVARFQTLCNYYKDDPKFAGQPKPITIFSGDAFNPSLESSVTKGMYDKCYGREHQMKLILITGSHMVPLLNGIGTDVACVGNHDLDFGVRQFRHLTAKCTFPWLLANILDPALGENVPLGNAGRTTMLTTSDGVKVGVIGLGEREWLATINTLPPNLIYKSVSETAKELVPELKRQGADIIIAVTHQREPNDNKLAEKTGSGLIDIILGGHDHFYSHSLINGTHVLRSGTDFKQLSYIEAWRKNDGGSGWQFQITRRDVVSSIKEDDETLARVAQLNQALSSRLEKPIGYTATPLDARFTTVRLKESNMGNFVCDLMRYYYEADCCMMAAGTIRGDQIYPPGILRMKDILNW